MTETSVGVRDRDRDSPIKRRETERIRVVGGMLTGPPEWREPVIGVNTTELRYFL